MAETAVLFVIDQVYKLLLEEFTFLARIHKEFAHIKDELESIGAFLKDADTRAIGDGDTSEGIKVWVKQLREVSFRIEDVIDEYIYLAQRVHHPGCIASFRKIGHLVKSLKARHRIMSEIEDINLSIRGIKERSERYNFQSLHEQGGSTGTKVDKWHDHRLSSIFIEESEVVGFESPRDELVGWLLEGAAERTAISVVGMGGLGKTTLAKLVFDSQNVTGHFDCCAFIIVSQSYTIRGLLIEMIEQFCKETLEPLPQNMHKMDEKTLITEVRQYLQQKRYLVFFDDVWKLDFSDEIELAMPNNNKGSRIIITTRMMHVAEFFKKAFPVRVQSLQLLPPNKAWELFCKKTFRYEIDQNCPLELMDMSNEIVQKCKGLPLAIVAIGGLLSTKAKTMIEWKKLTRNLSLELECNAHLTNLTKILSLSFDDLPYYLKACMLYFGVYPENNSISTGRLTRQWIAEGFVKNEGKRTLEEVAKEYLTELIHRSLVQVSKLGCDGKIKRCQVHGLLREVIMRKMKDLSFCHFVHEDDQPIEVGLARRLSIATSSKDVLSCAVHLSIRAVHIFEKGELPEDFMTKIFAKFKHLKVLDFEDSSLNYVPDNLGNFLHLRYLNLRNTKVQALPKSIGNLHNLETLDLRQTIVHQLPSEIKKLTKLRHLSAYYRNYETDYCAIRTTKGVVVKNGIEFLTSLQNLYFVEADHGELDLIEKLKKLRQLRRLGLRRVRREFGNALCASIVEMKELESLNITAVSEDEIIDLNFISSPPQLRWLNLKARLQKLPDWIPKLQYLVNLRLCLSMLEDDPLKSLKNLPNLLRLSLCDNAYNGEILHFEERGFPKLKKLLLAHLNRVHSIIIDNEALLDLEYLSVERISTLKKVPFGIKHLTKLKNINFSDMPTEFVESIDPNKGKFYCTINHVPLVFIRHKVGPKIDDYDTLTIHSSSKVSNIKVPFFSNHIMLLLSMHRTSNAYNGVMHY
ncbi:hypothetical protein TanjilG_02828 [Lupinus angustifolius]|uniref:NBS-containing resistance-like protein n=1 Tax=Lupinus angustifolius TaxID=3871 RepID=A0A4P1RLD0_LUPAN|nr:PREDICTED: disease resistance protein RPM1-like [Lupinus angustifolius]OIW13308.1 hypothetical protein TanjilG_02828 [Lupinus angustifolius]